MMLIYLPFAVYLLHIGSAELDQVTFVPYGLYSSSDFVWATNVPELQFNITTPGINVSFTYMIQMNAGISTANITLKDLLTNPSKLGQFNISAVNTSSNVIVSFSQPNPTASQSNISVTAGIVSKSQIITVRDCSLPDTFTITGKTTYNEVPLVQCRTGILYIKNARNENLYVLTARYTCQKDATWDRTDDYAGCFTGPIVDFATRTSVKTFANEASVRFYCYHEGSKSQMRLFNETITRDVIERDVVLSSKHHEKKVMCDKLEANGTLVIEQSEVTIRITFLPENVSPITQTKEMRVGDESILTLEFRAYPTLTNDDVSILLDGKSVTNFYVELAGVTHTIVIHFRSVTAGDFGLYIVSVKGLTLNYSLKEDPSPRLPAWATPGAIASIVLGCILFFILVLIVIVSVIQRKAGTGMDVEARSVNKKPIVKTQNEPTSSGNKYHIDNSRPRPSRAPPQNKPAKVNQPPPIRRVNRASAVQEEEEGGDTYESMMDPAPLNPQRRQMPPPSSGHYLASNAQNYPGRSHATQQMEEFEFDDDIYDN